MGSMQIGRHILTIILYGVCLLAFIGMFIAARRERTAMTLACGMTGIGALVEIQTLIFDHILHLIDQP